MKIKNNSWKGDIRIVVLLSVFIIAVFFLTTVSTFSEKNTVEPMPVETGDGEVEQTGNWNDKEDNEPTTPVTEDDDEKENKNRTVTERYAGISITQEDIELMARIVYLESNTETLAGQRMVAEVILNRVVQGDMGGRTIHDVIYARNQFTTAQNVGIAAPTEKNYQAVMCAIYETPITDADVVFFARKPYNDHVFCQIGAHWFCYKY